MGPNFQSFGLGQPLRELTAQVLRAQLQLPAGVTDAFPLVPLGAQLRELQIIYWGSAGVSERVQGSAHASSPISSAHTLQCIVPLSLFAHGGVMQEAPGFLDRFTTPAGIWMWKYRVGAVHGRSIVYTEMLGPSSCGRMRGHDGL